MSSDQFNNDIQPSRSGGIGTDGDRDMAGKQPGEMDPRRDEDRAPR